MRKGQKHFLKSIEKMKIAHKGCKPTFVGRKHSIKTKQQISKSRKGKCLGNQFAKGNGINKTSFKKGSIPWNKSDIKIYCQYCKKEIWPRDRLSRQFCSNKCKYKFFSGKTFKGSEKGHFKKYQKPWNYKLEATKQPGWLGGKSFEPYSKNFNKKKKKYIKNICGNKCFLCDKKEEIERKHSTVNRGLNIHHIDYNKKNNKTSNLVALCQSCHSKTNGNRELWIIYFKILCTMIVKI